MATYTWKDDNNTQGKTISFVKDIQLMMFGLGDCSNPLQETAQLIESVVLEQIILLLLQARDIADMRGVTTVGAEDILFLMRNNISALKRLMAYLALKDGKTALNKIMSVEEVPDLLPTLVQTSISSEQQDQEADLQMDIETEDDIKDKPLISWKKSRKGFCLQFLEKIGIEQEDIEVADDEVKDERLRRANFITTNLSSSAYEKYHLSRCASFATAQMSSKKFVEWIKTAGRYRDEITGPVSELLVYIAKETIATIVDMILILREETNFEPMIQPEPISPDEVREVIRRCWSQQSVSMSLFSRDVMPTIKKKLIAI